MGPVPSLRDRWTCLSLITAEDRLENGHLEMQEKAPSRAQHGRYPDPAAPLEDSEQ